MWEAVEAGHVTWSNATTNWLANGDLVITYKTGSGTLHLPGWTRAWALAVGGGGAGADSDKATNSGGAGGGGAGGFVETNDFLWAEGDLSIIVGAGGLQHASYKTGAGSAGGPSSIATSETMLMTALGGGGGAFKFIGTAGGSGGGGSAANSTASGSRNGGIATDPLQGCAGGKGAIVLFGAGGGGGGAKDPAIIGLGGGTGEAAKKGGGGNGGNAAIAAQKGGNGFGGGGGGAGGSAAQVLGAAGGDGVVLIRISMVIDGPLDKPSEEGPDMTYTGSKISMGTSIPNVYTLAGEYEATDVREQPYEYTMTLAAGLTWSDGTSDPATVRWRIIPGEIEMPQPEFESKVYDGNNHIVIGPKDHVTFVTGSVTNATDAGAYTYEAALEDPVNWRWTDGSNTNLTYQWTILPRQIDHVTPRTGFEFNGENHVAVDEMPDYFYTPDSVTNATDVGTYPVHYQLKNPGNTVWSFDGSVTNLTYFWQVTPRQVAVPTLPKGLVYAGTNAVAAVESDDVGFAEGSVVCATNAGVYTVVYKLKDPANNVWASDLSNTNLTYTWEIARKPVARPPVPGKNGHFTYDGTVHEAATLSDYYAFADGSTIQARNVRTGGYYFLAQLNGNWCWKDGDPLADHLQEWFVDQARNAITALRLSDWKLGDSPKPGEPNVTADFGANTATYQYSDLEMGPWTDELPDTNGVFYVRATIPATLNWAGAERTKRFLIYKNFDELFTDYVDIEPTEPAADHALTNHVILVKISESLYPGFSYERCGAGEDLAFMDLTPGRESPLSYDIDTWDPAGESLLWVKIPELAAGKTKIRMYWHLKPGKSSPGPAPTEVWSDYVGVWHFNESVAVADAPTTAAADATGRGHDALPGPEGGKNRGQMTSIPGQIGNARYNATGMYDADGNFFDVGTFDDCALGSGFIFEGWVKFDGYRQSKEVWILSRKAEDKTGGFALGVDGSNRKSVVAYGSSTTGKSLDAVSGGEFKGNWVHLTWAVSGNQYGLITHSPTLGTKTVNGSLNTSIGEDLLPLTFGRDLGGTIQSVYGAFDEFRLRPWSGHVTENELAALKNEAKVAYDNVNDPAGFVTHDWIVREGKMQNFWLTRPTLVPDRWADTDAPGVLDLGLAATGTSAVVYQNIFRPEEVFDTMPTTAGHYAAIVTVTVDGFDDLREEIGFSIVHHDDSHTIGATEEGHILLANDDSFGDWSGEHAITNQAYWMTRYIDYDNVTKVVITNYNPRGEIIKIYTQEVHTVVTTTNATYWTHSDEAVLDEDYPHLLPGITHTLETTNTLADLCYSPVLWRLENIRIGNGYFANLVESNTRNYLPYSSTSCPISSNGVEWTKGEIGNLVMRNTTKATVYSPCYTNGIGTIYFDAVNFRANDPASYYELQVEVATSAQGGKAIPTDENVHEVIVTTNNFAAVVAGDEPPDIIVTTNLYALADWQPADLRYVKFENGETTTSAGTMKTVALGVKAGGSTENFYRIIVARNVMQPARFRIRRVSVDPDSDSLENPDSFGQILLDNIIVSPPREWAEVKPTGRYDGERRGREVLGQENAWSVPFPSISDTAILARAEPIYHVSPGTSEETAKGILTKTVMQYRERYLTQRVGEWQEVVLNPQAGFGAMSPLKLSGLVSDLEFRFVSELQTPYWTYVDYSGTGWGVPGFTEEMTAITNVCTTLAADKSPTKGTDWFVRLREGATDYEGVALKVRGRDDISFEVVADHIWRAYLKTVDEIEEGIDWRIEPRNLQTPGSADFAWNTNYWFVANLPQRLPVSDILRPDGTTNSWSHIPCDATTGYLMFQVDDRTRSISVVHADYQNFDTWDDAAKADKFYGHSMTDGKIGVSAKKREIAEGFTYRNRPWSPTPAARGEWGETFEAGASQEYADYVPFGGTTTLGGWNVGPGMYVAQWFRETEKRPGALYFQRALQMEGSGQGWIQFPTGGAIENLPRGLGTVSFTARLGQFIDMDADLSYAQWPNDERWARKDYTFLSAVAFDREKNDAYAGNASVSLFAYYTPRQGAYEIRLEQTTKQPQSVRKLTLYRWTKQPNGSVTAVSLGSVTAPTTPVLTDGTSGYYTPLFISCQNEADATVVKFGIYTREKAANQVIGYSWNAEASDFSSKFYYNAWVYRDKSADRLKTGTYGVLAANCFGVFHQPHIGNPQPTAKTEVNKLVQDGSNAVLAFDPLFPCKEDLIDEDDEGCWNVNVAHMQPYWSSSSLNNWGLEATPISQKVLLQVAPRGQVDAWRTADTFEVKTFGRNARAGETFSHRFDRVGDYDVRLKVDGVITDPRTDIVIDDIQVEQWRGCSYGDSPDTTDFVGPNDGYGYRTNVVFMSGWVKNEVTRIDDKTSVTNASVLLSPKRTAGAEKTDLACGVRSPLFDGGGGRTDNPERGLGLGLIAFSWRNAQANAKLLVQIATNNVGSSAEGYDLWGDESVWTTVRTIDFSISPWAGQRASGSYAHYLGLHGVKGLMRVVCDPQLVRDVASQDYLDKTQYGEVEITKVLCRDEPPLDTSAWWGWNMQTTDAASRQYLVDNLARDPANGHSLGLNRGVDRRTDDLADPDDVESYKQEMPFVQTPTFTANTVGEITFRARKYDKLTGDAEVTLYGARNETDWHTAPGDAPVARFVVSNDTYATYTYKVKPGDGYKAFRLGVVGVKDVVEEHRGPFPLAGGNPVRVLIDEVLVSEAIYPEMGFRSCLPIRSRLTDGGLVTSVGLREEQPILGDAWSVQATIAVNLLPDELDLVNRKPRVFFHWFKGQYPWGFDAWRSLSEEDGHRMAELVRTEEDEMTFRGSYLTSPRAIVNADPPDGDRSFAVYQYAAELVYWDKKGNCITGRLNQAEWTRPEWYAPLDYNAAHAAERTPEGKAPFAAYNILETISPGRAWINEINLYDGIDENYTYRAEKCQYLEVAAPLTQSLRDWSVHYVDDDGHTNFLFAFGMDGVAETKAANATNNYVFVTVQSPFTRNAKRLSAEKGEVDGTWQVFDAGDTERRGELSQVYPVGFILKRPSGIVAQQIVAEGDNVYKQYPAFADLYSAKQSVIDRNEVDPEKLWMLAGSDSNATDAVSLGVTNIVRAAARSAFVAGTEMWTEKRAKTPGAVNVGQEIPADWAIYPSGDMVLLNATIVGEHIRHDAGDVTNSTRAALMAVKKGGEGTNITYHVDRWYEIGEIRENGVLKASGGGDGFVFAAGRDTQENVVTLTATARPREDLRTKYGLGPDNAYSEAVLDWLGRGKTMKGDFAYPGGIDLPIVRDLAGNYVTNLTLTEAYWLDIDPTGSNWCWKAGISGAPHEVYLHYPDSSVMTNVRMEVTMIITNESTVGSQVGLCWSPYVLRGKDPGMDSQQYARGVTNRWNSVSFKMTGDIQNGMPLRARWVPLRYFVFDNGSFDENHSARIDIRHPYAPDSLAVNYGWLKFVGCPVWYSWWIDERNAPVAIEVLRPTNDIMW